MNNDNFDRKNLVKEALIARKKAYVPYSNFQVGAALMTDKSTIYSGCNIENAAYTPCNCAERTAIFKAVSEGEYNFKAIAIVGGDKSAKELDYCAPCGVCRQVIKEFCSDDFEIILAKSEEDYKSYTLGELLPYGFGPDNLKKDS
ncbi:MAG: cytidine deaminase [Suipraeoptans sp.]